MAILQDIAKGSISDAHHADLRTQQFYMAYVNSSFRGTVTKQVMEGQSEPEKQSK